MLLISTLDNHISYMDQKNSIYDSHPQMLLGFQVWKMKEGKENPSSTYICVYERKTIFLETKLKMALLDIWRYSMFVEYPIGPILSASKS